MDRVVEQALAGNLEVPSIGCTSCDRLTAENEKLRKIVADQARLLSMADQFIKSYQSQNANRAARRAQSRKRSKAALRVVPTGPPLSGTLPDLQVSS